MWHCIQGRRSLRSYYYDRPWGVLFHELRWWTEWPIDYLFCIRTGRTNMVVSEDHFSGLGLSNFWRDYRLKWQSPKIFFLLNRYLLPAVIMCVLFCSRCLRTSEPCHSSLQIAGKRTLSRIRSDIILKYFGRLDTIGPNSVSFHEMIT